MSRCTAPFRAGASLLGVLLVTFAASALTGGSAGSAAGAAGAAGGAGAAASQGSSGPRRTSSPVRTLLVEPSSGLGKIYASIASAEKSIDLEMYELVDAEAENLLGQAATRGVDVRVILDHNLEGARNAPAYSYLAAHHVSVKWAPSGFTADHEKAMVVDTREVWIMTLNLTSEYYANTRDFAVLDTIPADVRAVAGTFDADFAGSPRVPSNGSDLVWSPTNSLGSLSSMIAGARSALLVENEEMSDATIVKGLVAAARRGVAVHVIMNDTSSYAGEFDTLVAAGARVGTYPGDPGLYIHAKVVVADPGTSAAAAFLGSENFSGASLLHNRELGLTTRNGALVGELATTLERDFAGSAAWRTSAPSSSAWCTASASPAADGYSGDYDVYIHSNQPYEVATASDASDTYSHETDAAGYTYITLWRQSPGERITVRVGSARCSTAA